MPKRPKFEVAPAEVLRQRHGLTAENRPVIRLNPANVPEKFRRWIPLAERWGVSDDLVREASLDKSTPAELRELLSFCDVYDEILDDWLAGPEASSKTPTNEYVAFSCLGMVSDLAKISADRKD